MNAAPLRQRNYALLWFAGLISLTGDWALRIALPIYVLQVTGSVAAVSVVVMVSVLPTLLAAPLAGVLVDRWDRRRVMLITNLAQSVLLIPLLFFDTPSRVWIVYLVAFAQATLAVFFGPAETALLPKVVPASQLVAANSLNALNNNLARLIGPMVGGFGAAYLGIKGIALLDMASFLLAAGLIFLVRGRYIADSERNGIVREFAQGLRTIRSSRVVIAIVSLYGITSIGEGIMATLFAPFVAGPLHGGAREIGWLMSAQAVGGVLGGLIGARLKPTIAPARLVVASLIAFGLIDVVIFNYPRFATAILPEILLFILVGIPAVIGGVGFMTMLQTAVADAQIGRVYSVAMTLYSLAGLGGAAIAGAYGERIGIINLLTVQGIAPIVAGIAFAVLTSGASVASGASVTSGASRAAPSIPPAPAPDRQAVPDRAG